MRKIGLVMALAMSLLIFSGQSFSQDQAQPAPEKQPVAAEKQPVAAEKQPVATVKPPVKKEKITAKKAAPIAKKEATLAKKDARSFGEGKEGKIVGDKVNVRTGPGSKHNVFTQLNNGEKIIVLAVQGDWYQISIPKESACWISVKFFKKDGEKGTCTGDNVNLRSGAGTNFGIVGTAQKGETFKVVAETEEWIKIATNEGVHGWVLNKFIDAGEINGPDLVEAEDQDMDAFNSIVEECQAATAIGEIKTIDDFDSRLKKLTAVKSKLMDLESTTSSPEVKKRCNAKIVDLNYIIRVVQEGLTQATNIKKMQEEKDIAIKAAEKAKNDADEKLRKAMEPPKFDATGWVESVGRFAGRPGTHRLIKGANQAAFLSSANPALDLNKYWHKYVGIKGTPRKVIYGGAETLVYDVLEIQVITGEDNPSVPKIHEEVIPPISKPGKK